MDDRARTGRSVAITWASLTLTIYRRALARGAPCDLAAIGIPDRILAGGGTSIRIYTGRRDGSFVIAVECTEPGATCFCTSMGMGPGADSGFDLAMTELIDGSEHRFLVRVGSPPTRRRSRLLRTSEAVTKVRIRCTGTRARRRQNRALADRQLLHLSHA